MFKKNKKLVLNHIVKQTHFDKYLKKNLLERILSWLAPFTFFKFNINTLNHY